MSRSRPVRKVRLPKPETGLPDWDVAIIDAEPEVVVNLDGLVALVKAAPVGVGEAMRRLQPPTLDTRTYARLEAALGGAR